MPQQTDFPLPTDLPRPEDDGAADHLVGMTMPRVSLALDRRPDYQPRRNYPPPVLSSTAIR